VNSIQWLCPWISQQIVGYHVKSCVVFSLCLLLLLSLFSRPVITNWYQSWFGSVQVRTMVGGKSLKVDKFTWRNNFSLWHIKIRTVLKQQGLWTPLLKPAPNPLPADITTMEEKAHSTPLLALEDHIIAKVAKEDIAIGMWCKL